MSDPKLTDERLRTYLDGNQTDRERLSAAVLTLDPRFTEVKPRRPRGGPDGGRDIECRFDGHVCYAAVGFRNSPNDGSDDKTYIKRKFEDDLKRALEANPDLEAFVFLTNVDLTPNEVASLIANAHSSGITSADIFYRERIRQLLDGSPAGFAIRLQYLRITMRDEEQLAFFASFGTEIQQVVSSGLKSLDSRINRIEFIAESQKALNALLLQIDFLRPMSQTDLSDFFFIMRIVDVRRRVDGGNPSLSIAGTPGSPVHMSGSTKQNFINITTTVWAEPGNRIIHQTSRVGPIGDFRYEALIDQPVFHLSAPVTNLQSIQLLARVFDDGPFPSISAIENTMIYFETNLDFARTVRGIRLVADDYVLFSLPAGAFKVQDRNNFGRKIPSLDKEFTGKYFDISHNGLQRYSFTNYTPAKLPR